MRLTGRQLQMLRRLRERPLQERPRGGQILTARSLVRHGLAEPGPEGLQITQAGRTVNGGGVVYLLHIEPPYKHARHYLGFTTLTETARLQRHIAGHGSPLIRAAIAAGSAITIERIWPDGSRQLERRLKRRGGSARHCPRCRPAWLEHRHLRERGGRRGSRDPATGRYLTLPGPSSALLPASAAQTAGSQG